ncbi:MAG: hypothetical protein D6769_03295 [Methanobacteriota archaeon]|nr:MAG: hypothetical protein D6769_03295 [Euryarchaeota archaeon]
MNFRSYLLERFGISLPYFLELEEGSKKVIAYSGKKEGEKYGLIAAKKSDIGYKPTSNFLQLYGGLAIRNVISLTKKEALAYARGEDIRIGGNKRGFVVVMQGSSCLGCGLVKDGQLINQIPKVRRI